MNLVQKLLSAATVVVAVVIAGYVVRSVLAEAPPIRVGVLHSLTGSMAISERSLVDAVQLAIAEINEAGGVLGRTVEAVVADGRSDADVFAREAERLIHDERVSVVIGCWTSASRKSVKPIVERYHHLMLYPLQHEGLEESPNIIYLGASPNQQIVPALKWTIGNLGRRVFLVGSDDVFPHAANAIIRDQLAKWRGEVVGEAYVAPGGGSVDSVDHIVQAIGAARPDAILNTLNGDANVAFLMALRRAGITARQTPTMSFSIAEEELSNLPRGIAAGDYAAWTYFQSVDLPTNDAFVRAFRRKYGEQRVTDDPIATAYVGVKLWARAVEAAGTPAPDAVRRTIVDRGYRGPVGLIFIDGDNRHAWKTVRIGRVRTDGQFEVVWSSERPVRPIPYPAGRTREQWDGFLRNLHQQWGSRWFNPVR